MSRQAIGVSVLLLLLSNSLPLAAQDPLGRFVNVRPVPGMDSSTIESAPYGTPDDLTIYFNSNRSTNGTAISNFDIWMASRNSKDEPFGTPVKLPPSINQDGIRECCPVLSTDGLTLSYTDFEAEDIFDSRMLSMRPSVDSDWGIPVSLPSVIDVGNIRDFGLNSFFDSQISEDGLALYFTGRREGDLSDGGIDLFVSRRSSVGEPFGPPVPLETINTPNWQETGHSVSSDELTIFYHSNQADRFNQLWVATRDSKSEDFGPPMSINDLGLGSEINLPGGTAEFTPFISQEWPAHGSKLYYGFATIGDDWDIYEATWQTREPGDANEDLQFDSDDIIAVLDSGKYESNNPAEWGDGDWNLDGRFDSNDIVAALAAGLYETGPYAASLDFDASPITVVPEPPTLFILMTALICFAAARPGRTRTDVV